MTTEQTTEIAATFAELGVDADLVDELEISSTSLTVRASHHLSRFRK